MEGNLKVNEQLPINNGIEVGLSKLQNTLNNLQQTENASLNLGELNEEIMVEQETDKDKSKHDKQKKNRELGELEENQILSARLRSGSGRVYSSGVMIGSSSINETSKSAPPSILEEDCDSICSTESINKMRCSQNKCCRNTSKLMEMMDRLQKSVDEIQSTTRNQTLTSASQAGTMRRIEDKTIENAKDIESLEKELDEYKFQLKLIANVVVRQDQQIAFLSKKVNEAQQREMYSNIVISGIIEKQNEVPLRVFNKFVTNQLQIQELIPAHRAYRIGSGKTRPLIVELRDPYTYKSRIYSHVANLKGKKNADGARYFVSDHLPDAYNEDRRRINDLISENKKKAGDEKLSLSAKRGRLLIDDKPYKKAIYTPGPAHIFKPDPKLRQLADEIHMVKGDEETLNESHFVAYAAAVQDLEDIQAAYTKVKIKFASASHVVSAFCLPGKQAPTLQDYTDDGEFGAGRTILNLLKEEKLMNIVVFMIRFHGGQNLGPIRFEKIKKVSQSAIQNLRKELDEYKKEEEEKRIQEQQASSVVQTGEDWSSWKVTPAEVENWETVSKKTV